MATKPTIALIVEAVKRAVVGAMKDPHFDANLSVETLDIELLVTAHTNDC